MKARTAVLVSCCLASALCFAQQAQQRDPEGLGDEHAPAGQSEPIAASPNATHDAIRAVRDKIIAAIDNKDADQLLAQLHEDVVLTAQDGNDLKVIRGHDGVRDYLERLLTGPNPGVEQLKLWVEVDELTIIHNGNTGIAFGTSRDEYVLADGSEFELPTRWSATLVTADGHWQVANLHVSTNLFDNPVLDVARRASYWIGGLAAVVGFVAGMLAMWFVRSKSSSSSSNWG